MAPEKTVSLAAASGSKIQSEDSPLDHTASCPAYLSLSFDYPRPAICHATVTVASDVIEVMYHQAALTQKRCTQTYGFNKGEVPIDYIKNNFKENLTEHLKEFLFKFCIINFLYHELRSRKFLFAGEPRLSSVSLELGEDAVFIFELSIVQPTQIYEWKYFPFRAPKRKNYKDLDRQVESFLQEEKDALDRYQALPKKGIQMGDWVFFHIAIVERDASPLTCNLGQYFWFKLGDDEGENPLREIFIGREEHESFCTINEGIQEYFSAMLQTDYNFCITIHEVVPQLYFCIEQLRKHFRIKTNKDMHQKLVEVFSYRNDLSQRRAMVEEALKLMINKHKVVVPNYLVLRQQKALLEVIADNPDYHVYRVQKDFQDRVRELAEKQAREMVFIDQIAYHENLIVSTSDVKCYLNLTNRARMKEFIYFTLPSVKVQGQEVPVPTEQIKHVCLREKALNHIIYHLTKK